VLEMLTAIRRDLEQMKTDRAAIAVQNEPPQITAEAQPERDQAPPEAATLAQAVEPQPRSARQRSRTAPRLKKSTSRRERRPEPPRPKKRKTPAPIQDEWGFFDPDQCGFSALLAKLEEIESDKPPDED
jgi:hypothetical protein